MVALIVLAWIACAVLAYAAHTLGTLLLWSIPIPVVMVAGLITMQRLYLDRPHVFTLRMPRRSPAKERREVKEQPKTVRHEGTSEEVERLDAAA
jgi:hypothetical protein